MGRRIGAVSGALAVGVLLSGACAGGGGGEASSGAEGRGTVSVPVTTKRVDGVLVATVEISVGGGPPVTVRLDTGSAGLVVTEDALGPQVQMSSNPTEIPYVGATVTGATAETTVAIGDVRTAEPIAITVAESSTCTDGATGFCSSLSGVFRGTQGFLGVATADTTAPASPTFSPLLQMPSPHDEGFAIALAPPGRQGRLVVGPVSAPAGAIALPMRPASPSTYPNGAPAYQKDVELCWTVGTSSACGPTDLDLGFSGPAISVGAFGRPAADGGQDVPAGETATMSAPGAGATVWQFTTSGTASEYVVSYSDDLVSPTEFNTGIGFFLDHVVAYDVTGGRILVSAR